MHKGQSRLGSATEVAVNYLIAFGISWITSIVVLHHMGFKASVADNFWITMVFTVVSIIRSYLVRRLFNYLHHRS